MGKKPTWRFSNAVPLKLRWLHLEKKGARLGHKGAGATLHKDDVNEANLAVGFGLPQKGGKFLVIT